MALEIKLNQKLSQTLVMTPQLQQAIKLLQLGRMEYLEVIERELLENPFLEDAGDHREFDGADGRAERQAEPADHGPLNDLAGHESAADANGADSGDYERDDWSDLPRLDQAVADLSSVPHEERLEHAGSGGDSGEPEFEANSLASEVYDPFADSFLIPDAGPRTRRDPYDDERPTVEAVAQTDEGLTAHLLWQLRSMELAEEEQRIAYQIVGNLDRNGYLCVSMQELAELCEKPVEDAERVLAIVQTLDPAGIGARDLRECLLIQLDQLGFRDSLAWRIVSDHLAEVELRRLEVIAKKDGCTTEQVCEALRTIQKLEPRPGRPFADDAPIYITPDVYVRKVGDDYVVSLNDQGIPRLRLSTEYQDMLRGKGKDDYVQEKLRSASWLIKSIQQRQQTIFKVTQSIMRYQREFLEHGVSALRPLVLRDISQDVGMHESTISRVTTNKYVHTPQGVFELKFFFSSGLKSGAGEVSSESVKDRIKELVAKEDVRNPLSDQAIVEQLKREGIDIARRTVAKYREMMGILSSSRRKRMF